MPDPHGFKRRGVLFVLSSPSGAGKSTIARKLLANEPELTMSVSATTRPIRPGEVDGRIITSSISNASARWWRIDEFLEWAHVFGTATARPRRRVRGDLATGRDVLFDIDWQGAQQLHQIAGGDVVRVFILPPSMEELRERLEKRATDTQEVIDAPHGPRRERGQPLGRLRLCAGQRRCRRIASPCVKTILAAERLKRSRQTGIIGFIRGLTR